MSDKIKSRDLSYDSTLPPFLQRLRDQNSGRGDTDRHERQIARPKKSKDPNDDDGPTVVDESGENLTKDEVDKLTGIPCNPTTDESPNVKGKFHPSAEPMASGALPDDETSSKRMASNVTDGAAQKKRKIVKVVGESADTRTTGSKDELAGSKPAKKLKKKAKVKLTYDED